MREVRIVGGTEPDALLLASRSAQPQNAPRQRRTIPGTLVSREVRKGTQAALSAA